MFPAESSPQQDKKSNVLPLGLVRSRGAPHSSGLIKKRDRTRTAKRHQTVPEKSSGAGRCLRSLRVYRAPTTQRRRIKHMATLEVRSVLMALVHIRKEAQRGSAPCPGSHRWKVRGQEFKPGSRAPGPSPLFTDYGLCVAPFRSQI